MNPILGALLLATVAFTSAHANCYDAQVATDQHFDDAFVCKDHFPYPAELIEADLQYADMDTLYFLHTATSSFNETNYFTRAYQEPGNYAYQCVCPSPRKRVERVYLNNDVCFVVYPEKQDIQYAQCGGHCSFDYGTQIATASRGYFCVYQSFVQRQFLVWCPNVNGPAPQQPAPGQTYGRFERITRVLPTLCSCRGYFCDNHMHADGHSAHAGSHPAVH